MHRGEVREHAAEPAVVHVGHPDARGLLGHGLLGLLLGADEEDGAAVRDGLLDELVRAVDVRQRLLEVDDVDAVALGEDEALHLRVPTAGLVPEVDTARELAHGHDGHDTSFRRAARDPPGARTLLAAPPVGRAAVRLSVTTLVVAPWRHPCRRLRRTVDGASRTDAGRGPARDPDGPGDEGEDVTREVDRLRPRPRWSLGPGTANAPVAAASLPDGRADHSRRRAPSHGPLVHSRGRRARACSRSSGTLAQ